MSIERNQIEEQLKRLAKEKKDMEVKVAKFKDECTATIHRIEGAEMLCKTWLGQLDDKKCEQKSPETTAQEGVAFGTCTL